MEQRLNEANIFFATADSSKKLDVNEIFGKIPEDFSGTIGILGNLACTGENLIFPKANLFVTGRVYADDIVVSELTCSTLVCNKAKISGIAVITKDALCKEMEVASDLFAGLISAEYVLVGGDFSYNYQNVQLLRVIGKIKLTA